MIKNIADPLGRELAKQSMDFTLKNVDSVDDALDHFAGSLSETTGQMEEMWKKTMGRYGALRGGATQQVVVGETVRDALGENRTPVLNVSSQNVNKPTMGQPTIRSTAGSAEEAAATSRLTKKGAGGSIVSGVGGAILALAKESAKIMLEMAELVEQHLESDAPPGVQYRPGGPGQRNQQ